jgi:hypothetical protein
MEPAGRAIGNERDNPRELPDDDDDRSLASFLCVFKERV